MNNITNIESKFVPYPVFRSDRIYLRKLQLSDCNDMFEYASQPEVSFFENWQPHKTLSETKSYLRWVKSMYFKRKIKTWAIVLNNGKMIGTVSFVKLNEDHLSAEIGYTVSNKFWGNGYAKEAAYQLIRFAFTELNLERVYARVIKENTRSVKVLKNLGFTYEGTARNANFYNYKLSNVMYFSILKDEFFNTFGV